MRSFFEHEISNQINFANSERHISEVLTHKDPIYTPITFFEFGLPKYQLQRLQYVQNTAARVVLQVSKFQHITPVLCKLYWLPSQYRIIKFFKILLLVYKSLNGTSPSYLAQKLHYRSHTRSLRSVSNELLMQPEWYTKTCGDRAFAVYAPREWNLQPYEIQKSNTFSSFKRSLKTYRKHPCISRTFFQKIEAKNRGCGLSIDTSMFGVLKNLLNIHKTPKGAEKET